MVKDERCEGSRTNLITSSGAPISIPDGTPVETRPRIGEGRFTLSWFAKEWVPLERRWWHRLTKTTPAEQRWVRYQVGLHEYDAETFRAVVSVRLPEAGMLQVEEDLEPTPYIRVDPPEDEG